MNERRADVDGSTNGLISHSVSKMMKSILTIAHGQTAVLIEPNNRSDVRSGPI